MEIGLSGPAVPQLFSPVTNIPSPTPTETFSIPGDLTGNDGIPPDTEGAVGKSYIVTGLNYLVVVTDRAGKLISDPDLNSFWHGVTGLIFNFVTDPHFLYDPYTDRYIAAAIANTDTTAHQANAMVLIAVTQSDDPTQFWNGWAYRDDPSGGVWYDYPSTGFNASWVGIGLNVTPVGGETFTNSLANAPTQAGVQWCQLSTTGTVQQTGILQDPNGAISYGTGSIAANAKNERGSSSPSPPPALSPIRRFTCSLATWVRTTR